MSPDRGELGAVTDASPRADAVLDESVCPTLLHPAARPGAPEQVFLTGATGFIGAFVLHGLLTRFQARAACLVRGATPAAALARLRETMQGYGIWRGDFAERIEGIPGDLGAPLLGLTPAEFAAIGERSDAIYHCAGVVNLREPYSRSRLTNVLGTREVIRLARTGRPKPLQYISSVSCFGTSPRTRDVVMEGNPLPEVEQLPLGSYAQSKWVGEKLAQAARARGLSVGIYRPTFVGWHSRTGAHNTNDFVCRLIKGCVRLGLAPDVDLVINVIPIDFVCAALEHLAAQDSTYAREFFFVNPHRTTWHEVLDMLSELGAPIERVPFRKWRAAAAQAPDDDESPRRLLLPLLAQAVDSPSGMSMLEFCKTDFVPRFDCSNLLGGLAGSGLRCPPLDAAYLAPYLAQIRSGGATQSAPA